MRKGLLILGTDNINLSLIPIYKEIIERDIVIDCFATKKDKLSLHAFESVQPHWIEHRENLNLSDYDFAICGRTCFIYFSPKDWLNYRGVIYTDDTAFYEGHDVYGDVVFVNGECNADNISLMDYLDVRPIGCLKSSCEEACTEEIWGKSEKRKILYIESGHYPFGSDNRRELAIAIADMVMHNQDSMFVVKPRFLIGEAAFAGHRNEDYLLFYFKEIFGEHWPSNLVWLNQYYSLNSLISEADVIIHTYSSAHAQGALLGKKIVNIFDLSSYETADFRTNRIKYIQNIIDKAGNNISIKEIKCGIDRAIEPHKTYIDYLGGAYIYPEKSACDIIEKGSFNDELARRSGRLKGYFNHLMCYLENRFDNYTYFSKKIKTYLGYIDENNYEIDSCIAFIHQSRDEIVLQYINEYWNAISKNRFDRAYSMRELFSMGKIELVRKMLDDGYNENNKDSAFFYYMALVCISEKSIMMAKNYAKKYLEMVEERKYEILDCDKLSDIDIMKGIVYNENCCVYAD